MFMFCVYVMSYAQGMPLPAAPISPNPATLGQHYHSMPSTPNLQSDQGDDDETGSKSGKAAHRISLFDALGSVAMPPPTPTKPSGAENKAPTVAVEAVPFPAMGALSKEEHGRMVSAAEDERARRAYLRKQAWFTTPPGQALRDRDHKLPIDEAPYWSVLPGSKQIHQQEGLILGCLPGWATASRLATQTRS